MRLRQGEQGAAVVEFALVVPILMMFIFGIVEFGRGYNARIELTSAVREGARTAALWSGTCPPPAAVPASTFAQCVTKAVQDGAPGLTRSAITVTITMTPPSIPPQCPTNSATEANVNVLATYPFRYDIPFVGSRSTTLSATGVMRCHG